MTSVNRVFDILEVLVEKWEGLNISELSKLSKVSYVTTYRICSELAKRGYLKQRSRRGKYSIGIKFLEFNIAIQHSLKIGDRSLSHLQRLSRLSGESSQVAVLNNYAAINMAQAEAAHKLKISNSVGDNLPLHATSIGKVLLAYMSIEERKAFYRNQKLKQLTDNTLTSVNQLEHEVEKIRQNGFAIDNEEYNVGVWSVAAPIYDSNDLVIASLALTAPSVRLDGENNKNFISMVKQSALEISKEMGYKC